MREHKRRPASRDFAPVRGWPRLEIHQGNGVRRHEPPLESLRTRTERPVGRSAASNYHKATQICARCWLRHQAPSATPRLPCGAEGISFSPRAQVDRSRCSTRVRGGRRPRAPVRVGDGGGTSLRGQRNRSFDAMIAPRRASAAVSASSHGAELRQVQGWLDAALALRDRGGDGDSLTPSTTRLGTGVGTTSAASSDPNSVTAEVIHRVSRIPTWRTARLRVEGRLPFVAAAGGCDGTLRSRAPD